MPSNSGRTIESRPVTRIDNGHDLAITIHRVTGSRPGPTLVIFGGIHGDEAMGVEEVRRIVKSVDPAELSGTLVAVPVANPYSFAAMSRFTPADGVNLNRIFPGDRHGSVTEQLAAVLSEIMLEGDYFIDFHSSGLYSTVDYSYVMPDCPELAIAYGCPLLYQHEQFEGTANSWAISNGIKSMISELGGGGQLTASYLSRAVEGTRNLMRVIGMLDGAVLPPAQPQRVATRMQTLRPTAGGTMISRFAPESLGSVVRGGTVLGEVLDSYTFAVIEQLVAPFEENVLVLTREEFTRVAPGDYGFMVADVASIEPADERFPSR